MGYRPPKNGLHACHQTRKFSYASNAEAKREGKRLARDHQHYRYGGTYRCPHCGNWHLTSQPKRKAER